VGIATAQVQALQRFAAPGVVEDRDKAEAVCYVSDWPASRSSECAENLSAGRAARSGAGILRRPAAMVLLAGIGMPENRRISRSRILRAPQLACSRFTFRM